ncbi:MAG: hypothetical protein ABSB31_00555 [Dehalococcoidia bacterium]|jgi:hypothetical protein
MEKTWMPTVAGILDIVSGAFGLCMGLFMTFARHAASAVPNAARQAAGAIPNAARQAAGAIPNASRFGMHPPIPAGFHPWMGIALIVISILAVIGGIFALRVKNWGLALAGSIAAVISGRLLGVLALILIVLGKKDFDLSGTKVSV